MEQKNYAYLHNGKYVVSLILKKYCAEMLMKPMDVENESHIQCHRTKANFSSQPSSHFSELNFISIIEKIK